MTLEDALRKIGDPETIGATLDKFTPDELSKHVAFVEAHGPQRHNLEIWEVMPGGYGGAVLYTCEFRAVEIDVTEILDGDGVLRPVVPPMKGVIE